MRRTRTRRIAARFTDPSDGLAALVGAYPDLYLRAQDASSSIWPARIGTDGTGTGTPLYDADDWPVGDNPVIKCVTGEGDYIRVDSLAAARAADPDASMTLAMAYVRRAATAGVAFGLSNSTVALRFMSFFLQDDGDGTFTFFTRTGDNNIKDQIVGVGSLSLNTAAILVFSYGGGKVHLTAHTSAGEAALINDQNTVTLDAADFAFDTCSIANARRGGSDQVVTSDFGEVSYWHGTRLANAQHSALAAQIAQRYPLA